MKNYADQSHSNNKANQSRATIKPGHLYCKKDLANMYGISYKTLEAWLRPRAELIGPIQGRYYTSNQLRIIFDLLGFPGDFEN